MNDSERHTGSCLCGGVRYEVRGPLRPVVGCHCVQCRKWTGHYMAATAARLAEFRVVAGETLRWFRSSDTARRGFCAECGSSLFWQGDGRDYVAIAAGTLDGATGLATAGHIFCDFAGDYYAMPDGEYHLPGSGRSRAAW